MQKSSPLSSSRRKSASGTSVLSIRSCLDQLGDANRISGSAVVDCVVLKLDSNAAWQKKRLIVTADRINILLSSPQGNEQVADYILMDQIRSVCRMDSNTIERGCVTEPTLLAKQPSTPGPRFTDSNFKQPASNQTMSILPESFLATSTAVANWKLVASGSEKDSAFEVHTFNDGLYRGKTFYFSTGNEKKCEDLISKVTKYAREARSIYEKQHRIEQMQLRLQRFYKSLPFQGCVAALIILNFAVTITQNEILADTAYIINIYESIDLAFTIVFVVELFINFLANAVRPFIRDGWNWFDTVVVFASVILIPLSGNNGIVKQLRVLRVVRVIRVFGRFGQFRKVVNAILHSILPGAQALAICLVVVAIYSTIGVQFFGGQDENDFGDFFHAFYTLFCVVAFARWPESQLTPFYADGSTNIGVIVFLYSFVVIVMFVLLQVVVAVILDNFYKSSARADVEAALEASANAGHAFSSGYPCDPLFATVLSEFDTNEDLDEHWNEFFRVFDVDGTGTLSFGEISEGLFRMDPDAKQRLTVDDFSKMTGTGKLCDSEGELGLEQFKEVMLQELKKFTQRKFADALCCVKDSIEQTSLLSSVKMTMVDISRSQEVLVKQEAKFETISRQSELIIKLQEVTLDKLLQEVSEMKQMAMRARAENCETSTQQHQSTDTSNAGASIAGPVVVAGGGVQSQYTKWPGGTSHVPNVTHDAVVNHNYPKKARQVKRRKQLECGDGFHTVFNCTPWCD